MIDLKKKTASRMSISLYWVGVMIKNWGEFCLLSMYKNVITSSRNLNTEYLKIFPSYGGYTKITRDRKSLKGSIEI